MRLPVDGTWPTKMHGCGHTGVHVRARLHAHSGYPAYQDFLCSQFNYDCTCLSAQVTIASSCGMTAGQRVDNQVTKRYIVYRVLML
jgi:hypothetical protein